MTRFARLLALFMTLAGPVHAAEQSPLPATSKWQVDLHKDRCRLLRTFGDGQVTLEVAATGLERPLSVSVATRSIPRGPDHRPVSLTLSGPRQPLPTSGLSIPGTTAAPPLLYVAAAPDLREALAAEATTAMPSILNMSFGQRPIATLALGPMRAPLAIFDQCMDALLTGWGLDPAQQRHLRTPTTPRTDVATWINQTDYPSGMPIEGGSGVAIRLNVDARGLPTACHVSVASGDAIFRDIACRRLMQRARFNPAIDASGKPAPSIWSSRVLWLSGPPG